MESSFLSILSKYFSNIPEKDILLGDKHHIEIPFEWLFTENLDRDIIQKALANIFMRNNPTYKKRAKFKHHNPDKLDIISVQFDRFTHSIQLFILGADEWSKLVITDDPNPRGRIHQITSNELNEEITNVLKQKKLDKITNSKLPLSSSVQTTFVQMLSSSITVENVSSSMCRLAENLVEYYKELINVRDNNPTMLYAGVIEQEQDEGETNRVHSLISGSSPRKSLIYSFVERSKIFNNLHPSLLIATDVSGKQGQVIKNAYITYIFSNPRDYQGYLFICEPLEGFHETRVFFIPEEQFNEYNANGTNKFVDINNRYIEKSSKAFKESRRTKILKHNDIESFTDRVNYFVTGKKNARISEHLSSFKQADAQLFGGEYVSKAQLRDAVSKRKSSDLKYVSVIFCPNTTQEKIHEGGEEK